MLKIGLTGSPGTGKSTVLKLIKALGIPVQSSDSIVRDFYKKNSPVSKKVARTLGAKYLLNDGRIDRKSLRKLIFYDAKARKRLERIIHPEVKKARALQVKKLERRGVKIAVFEVPLLFEAGLEGDFDKTLFIASSKKHQIERLVKRDRISKRDAAALIASQMHQADKRKRANFVIINNSGMERLKSKVIGFFERELKAIR